VSKDENLYRALVKITHEYLGPAAERFIERQIRNHLHKEPEQLTKKDLSSLVDWVRAAVSLLTDDADVIEEYIRQVKSLTGRPKKN
jgi:hypothetical protein